MGVNEQDDLPLSRTKKKQQAKQVEQVAERLVALADNQFSQLSLPEDVLYEAQEARSTKGLSSQRRQLKYLAGLLRKMPEALNDLLQQLQDLDQVGRSDKKQFHQLEKMRDRLCSAATFSAAFDEMIELMPEIDRKTISRLARSVQEHDDRRAYREIFQRLKGELKGK